MVHVSEPQPNGRMPDPYIEIGPKNWLRSPPSSPTPTHFPSAKQQGIADVSCSLSGLQSPGSTWRFFKMVDPLFDEFKARKEPSIRGSLFGETETRRMRPFLWRAPYSCLVARRPNTRQAAPANEQPTQPRTDKNTEFIVVLQSSRACDIQTGSRYNPTQPAGP